MKGLWLGFLDVDLSASTVKEVAIPEEWGKVHLGGRGIGARLLLCERIKQGTTPDALGPHNPLVFLTGPLQGFAMPGSGKHVVMGWSPKTGRLNESYAGGIFGYQLARTGFDGLILRGQAASPCYLVVTEGLGKLQDASDLWGLNTEECETRLRERHGAGSGIASIGPAGERLVTFSCIIHDGGHAAGRPGFGAVMGSKRIKAIVVNGHATKPVADMAGLPEIITQFSRLTLANPGIRDFMIYGTSAGVEFYNELGILPTKNFQKGFFKEASRIGARAINNSILVRREGCAGCAVRCRPIVKIGTQEFEGPEYETLAGFGSLCLVDDLATIALAHRKSNLYGLDAISTGVLIAYLMEASQKNLLPEKEKISWGDGEKLLRLIDLVAYREGIGDFFAQGLETVSKKLGGKDFAVHIKGVEVPLHDPRGKRGLAISYATSPRGATHLEAMHDEMFEGPGAPTADIGITEPLNRFSWERKAMACKLYEDLYSFVNSAIICGFVSWNQSSSREYYPFRHIRRLLNTITGLEMDTNEMLHIGERNYLIRRLLTALDGHTRDDDDLPQRFKEPLQNGIWQGERIADKALNRAIDEYYKLRGMDHYGPTDAKLDQLGLSDLKGLVKR